MISADDFLNGSTAGPILAPPLASGNTPMVAAGAGNASSSRSLNGTPASIGPASSNTAIILVWLILLVLLVLSHTFTFSLQE